MLMIMLMTMLIIMINGYVGEDDQSLVICAASQACFKSHAGLCA